MNKTVIFDFNNLAHRLLFLSDIEITSSEPNYNLWKFLIFDNIYKSLIHVENANEIVLAIDDSHSWRKEYWKRYKEKRKDSKNKDVDWKRFYQVMDSFLINMKNHLPFKILKIKWAEADDIIASICMNISDRDFHIISNDEDFIQLLSLPNVKIYNPRKKEYTSHDNPKSFIIEKCLTGQPKDGIFNIKTPIDWDDTKGKRKPGFGIKSAEKVMANDVNKWLKENGYEDRFKLNRILIDFNFIPKTLSTSIMKKYNNYVFPEKIMLWKFFNDSQWKEYIDKFVDIEMELDSFYK